MVERGLFGVGSFNCVTALTEEQTGEAAKKKEGLTLPFDSKANTEGRNRCDL